ncbi:MAG TPA: OmpH family outer membrane protein [Flavobacterium sp.]|nr:OmpH family outer membrane protein [Flavobacterium sp.]
MKKLASLVLICICNLAFAQKGRIAIIDTDFIMSKMPEYEEANKELKKRDAEWQLVIERKKKEIKDLKDQLNVERPLLTQQLIDEKEEDIQIIEKELSEFQQEKYNSKDGSYFQQKLALARPIQAQINTIVEEIATKKRYTMVIDKSSSSEAALMYINQSDEISDQILRKLEQTRNKSKLSKKEIAQIEEADRLQDIKERQRTKRDDLEDRQRLLEEEKEQKAAANPIVQNNEESRPTESPEEKRRREQLEKVEKAKQERERLQAERLKALEKQKEEIAKKQEELRLAREKARADALNNKNKPPQNNAPSNANNNKDVSDRVKQMREQQEQRKKEAEEKRAKILEERKRLAEERKQKLEEEKQKRLKEIEERKKGLENKK